MLYKSNTRSKKEGGGQTNNISYKKIFLAGQTTPGTQPCALQCLAIWPRRHQDLSFRFSIIPTAIRLIIDLQLSACRHHNYTWGGQRCCAWQLPEEMLTRCDLKKPRVLAPARGERLDGWTSPTFASLLGLKLHAGSVGDYRRRASSCGASAEAGRLKTKMALCM